ncbi:MAG: lactate utilization protein [Desulfobacterales bacterium]|nr:lactate utilization protein [Desulfobacterales bacterium]
MTNDYQDWRWQKLGEKCVENLKKNEFDARLSPSIDDARQIIEDITGEYETFGFGGSDTSRSLGIIPRLKKKGKTVYDHWEPGLSPETYQTLRLQQGRCDCFFCSANAISATGEVVNVDGIGNRTSAMMFGPKKVVIVAGMNKVTHTLQEALDRVREVAGPMRAKSLNMEAPCAKTGFCSDCNAPQRICRITAILHRKPMLTDVSVILIKEHLGF